MRYQRCCIITTERTIYLRCRSFDIVRHERVVPCQGRVRTAKQSKLFSSTDWWYGTSTKHAVLFHNTNLRGILKKQKEGSLPSFRLKVIHRLSRFIYFAI